MHESCVGVNAATLPDFASAKVRMSAIRPDVYARSRNAINGAVSGLSPYITHGIVGLRDVLSDVNARNPMDIGHKFVSELGWREYFRHVWQHRGAAIFQSLQPGPLPDACYSRELPPDIRVGKTGIPAIDLAVRNLTRCGTLHNHARLWLASYVVHLRKVHWRTAADWFYGHLLDGDLASNHLSWQWVAATASHKPYLFNADNVERFAPSAWHSRNTPIDTSYEALDAIARTAGRVVPSDFEPSAIALNSDEPTLFSTPPHWVNATQPDACDADAEDIWLVHPWSLGDLPEGLPPRMRVIAIFVAEFHEQWPWSANRWQFVGTRMCELAPTRWHGSALSIGTALKGARRVRAVGNPHLATWLSQWADCSPEPALFPAVKRPCSSFSQWWKRATCGIRSAADLLGPQPENRT